MKWNDDVFPEEGDYCWCGHRNHEWEYHPINRFYSVAWCPDCQEYCTDNRRRAVEEKENDE